MEVKIRYNKEFQELEVPRDDFRPMIEADYQERLANARANGIDEKTILPRTPQEILDEEINKPEYNNTHRFQRHNDSLESMALEQEASIAGELTDLFHLYSKEETRQRLAQAFCRLSEKQHRRFLMALDGMSLRQIAEQEQVPVSAIAECIDTAKQKIMNFLLTFEN